MIPQHSSATNEHYTPTHIVDAARLVLGEIDLDPASCEEANWTVRADVYWDKDVDGLSETWAGRVFLNPPGGILRRGADGLWRPWKGGGGSSSMVVWWDHLIGEYLAERVTAAIFVGFTLEILRTAQVTQAPVQAFPRCYPASRLRFGGNSPTHGNVIVYLPPAGDPFGYARFVKAFSPIGLCEPGADVA